MNDTILAKSDDLLEGLIYFIREQIGEHNKIITKETIIEDDLGVTGEEAEELIIHFGKRYSIDISKFDFGKYFYNEPGVFNLQSQVIKPFTVGHLAKAVIAGRLDEEVINS